MQGDVSVMLNIVSVPFRGAMEIFMHKLHLFGIIVWQY